MIASRERQGIKHSQDIELRKKATVTLASPHTKTCVHHWIIETAKSQYSKGYCENCGEKG